MSPGFDFWTWCRKRFDFTPRFSTLLQEEGFPRVLLFSPRLKTKILFDTGIKSFCYLCRKQRIVGQKVSTNSRMAALLSYHTLR